VTYIFLLFLFFKKENNSLLGQVPIKPIRGDRLYRDRLEPAMNRNKKIMARRNLPVRKAKKQIKKAKSFVGLHTNKTTKTTNIKAINFSYDGKGGKRHAVRFPKN
jgi:hypothetical protein